MVYPRAYGGTRKIFVTQPCEYGLSPRVRGNLGAGKTARATWGSIPARTGEPCAKWFATSALRVRSIPARTGEPATALIPDVMPMHRSIPARTGEPGEIRSRQQPIRVYPRAYGGTRGVSELHAARQGLSPRVRGNPRASHSCLLPGIHRSIPARTGEPTQEEPWSQPVAVYPRAYGGTPKRFKIGMA